MFVHIAGGRKRSPVFLLPFLLLFLPQMLYAYETALTLDRPKAFDAVDGGRLELWGQYDKFQPSLDFMNFASKTGSSSKINKYSNQLLGINYALTDHVHVRYRYLNSNQYASRLVEPTSIHTTFTGQQFNLEYTWFTTDYWHLSANIGFRSHRAKKIGFLRYKSGRFTLISLNGVPVVAFSSSDSAWTTGLQATWHPNNDFYMTLGLEGRKVKVSTLFESSLLNNSIVGSILRAEAPQRTPWSEYHAILSVSTDWAVMDWLTLSADARYYRVRRSSAYIPKVGKKDQNANIQLDGYLFVHLPKDITAYVHGRAYQHYLLGDIPMMYNTRTSHIFKNPFGFVSIGLGWQY